MRHAAIAHPVGSFENTSAQDAVDMRSCMAQFLGRETLVDEIDPFRSAHLLFYGLLQTSQSGLLDAERNVIDQIGSAQPLGHSSLPTVGAFFQYGILPAVFTSLLGTGRGRLLCEGCRG